MNDKALQGTAEPADWMTKALGHVVGLSEAVPALRQLGLGDYVQHLDATLQNIFHQEGKGTLNSAHRPRSPTPEPAPQNETNGTRRQYLPKLNIDSGKFKHRNHKATIFKDVILMALYIRDSSQLYLDDIKSELGNQGIIVQDPHLMSRLSRMRSDKYLRSVDDTGAGVYELTDQGRKAAEAALKKNNLLSFLEKPPGDGAA